MKIKLPKLTRRKQPEVIGTPIGIPVVKTISTTRTTLYEVKPYKTPLG
jgi:hypothetical protein